MSPEEKVRLTHIAEAAVLIARYLEGVSKQEFLEDTLRQDHDYDGVNIGRVWDTAIEDIPVLRAAAEKYLKLGRSEIAKPMNKIGSRSLCALVVGRIL
jgi:uncharacterized protein with HEPN domain